MGRESQSPTTVIDTQTKTKTQRPSMYKVILVNDDFTPMDFVISVLKRIFNKDESEATKIMLDVHHKGIGTAGIYTYEIAETKTYQALQLAKKNQYPLQCRMEKE